MPLLQLLGGALLTALLVTGAGLFETAFPFMVPILLLAVPVPAAYLHLRQGTWTGGGVILLAAGLLVMDGWPSALEYLVLFGPGSFVVPFLLRRRIHWDRAVAGGALATLGVIAPVLAGTALYRGLTPNGLVRGYMEAEVTRAHQLWAEMSLPPNQVAELERLAALSLEWVPRLYPAIMALTIGVLMLVMVSVLRRLMRRHLFIPGPMFHQWKLPEPLVWVLIAAGFAAIAPWDMLNVAACSPSTSCRGWRWWRPGCCGAASPPSCGG